MTLTLASSDQPSAIARLIALEQGLYILEIGETQCMRGQMCRLQVPAGQVSAPLDERACRAETVGNSDRSDAGRGHDGGTVIATTLQAAGAASGPAAAPAG